MQPGFGPPPAGIQDLAPLFDRRVRAPGDAVTDLERVNAAAMRVRHAEWRLSWVAECQRAGAELAAAMCANFADFFVVQRILIVHRGQLITGPLGLPSGDRWTPRELREYAEQAAAIAMETRPAFEQAVAGLHWAAHADFFGTPWAGKPMAGDLKALGARPLAPLARLLVDFGLVPSEELNLFRSEFWPSWREHVVDGSVRGEARRHPVVVAFGRLASAAAKVAPADRRS